MKLILIRHGQSEWNLQKKFTGWVNVSLTERGVHEAKSSGKLINNLNLEFNDFFSSFFYSYVIN